MDAFEVKSTFGEMIHEEKKNGREFSHTDIRVAFGDYVDSLCKNGQITEELAYKITL